jgi:hypothetical protein
MTFLYNQIVHGKAGGDWQGPLFFARASVEDMIPIKEAHPPVPVELPGSTGGPGKVILFPLGMTGNTSRRLYRGDWQKTRGKVDDQTCQVMRCAYYCLCFGT